MFTVLSAVGDHSIARFGASVENVSFFLIDFFGCCFIGVDAGNADFFMTSADVCLAFFGPIIDLFPRDFISVGVGGWGGEGPARIIVFIFAVGVV